MYTPHQQGSVMSLHTAFYLRKENEKKSLQRMKLMLEPQKHFGPVLGAMEDSAGPSLRARCFQAIRTHFSVIGADAVLSIPTSLIVDLLPHLTACQLHEVQPALNLRGVSTHSGWIRILRDLSGHCNPLDFDTEEKAKHEVMRNLFTLVFYSFRNHYVLKNSTNLKNSSFLWAAAKCIQYFLVIQSLQLQTLISDQRPLLSLLERRITTVGVSSSWSLSRSNIQTALYILHRLLDHGSATQLVLHTECPSTLAWLLRGRGPQSMNVELKSFLQSSCTPSASSDEAHHSPGPDDQRDHVAPCKRSRLDSEEPEGSTFAVDPQVLCQTLGPCVAPSAGPCPWGQITCLDLRYCESGSFKVLNSALPTFFCLRSLTLHCCPSAVFREADVLGLAAALKKLSDSSCSSLSDLSLSILPCTRLMKTLLDAFPRLTSLYLEVQKVLWGPHFIPNYPPTAVFNSSSASSLLGARFRTELSLEKLTVKVTEDETDLRSIMSLLNRCPRLTSLHLAGLRPTGSTQSQLLTTLSESNCQLRVLHFEDIKLCDCLPEILNLLRSCNLEELRLSDCRLLEKCANQEERLLQLVAALKMMHSLHKLSLAQNRLAKNIYILAELFSGPTPSAVRYLDISSNFVLPSDLLEFAKRLRAHPPTHGLVLDLRKNPADRDPDKWTRAVQKLQPISLLLDEGWKSTNMMVDHVSNM